MHIKRFIMLIAVTAAVTSVSSGNWPKAILAGDYPDPTILRDGKDFYMTHSPFYYQPGFLIWHSTDLMNWSPVCRALESWQGSAMAPDLVKYGDKYYIYFPAAGTNYVTVADDIRGRLTDFRQWARSVKSTTDGKSRRSGRPRANGLKCILNRQR